MAVSLLPTLVFTLVLAQILRERFAVSSAVFGGPIVYAVVNTMIPGLLLQLPLPEFEEPYAHDLPPGDLARLEPVRSASDGARAMTEQA